MNPSSYSPSLRSLTAACCLAVLALGCGGGDSDDDSNVSTASDDGAGDTDGGSMPAEMAESDDDESDSNDDAGSSIDTDEDADDSDDDVTSVDTDDAESPSDTDDSSDDDDGSSSSNGSSGGVIALDTNIPDDTPLGDLDAAQQEELCRAIDEALTDDELARAQCELLGGLLAVLMSSTDEEFREACVASSEECLQTLESESTGECDPSEIPEDCAATIGDYETCVNQTFAALPVSCDSTLVEATAALLSSGLGEDSAMADSPECERVQACSDDSGSDAMSMFTP